jgi:hypothetical protein
MTRNFFGNFFGKIGTRGMGPSKSRRYGKETEWFACIGLRAFGASGDGSQHLQAAVPRRTGEKNTPLFP